MTWLTLLRSPTAWLAAFLLAASVGLWLEHERADIAADKLAVAEDTIKQRDGVIASQRSTNAAQADQIEKLTRAVNAANDELQRQRQAAEQASADAAKAKQAADAERRAKQAALRRASADPKCIDLLRMPVCE